MAKSSKAQNKIIKFAKKIAIGTVPVVAGVGVAGLILRNYGGLPVLSDIKKGFNGDAKGLGV